MEYIVKDSSNKKMIMNVVGSMPQLPEGFDVLGLASELPEAIIEIETSRTAELAKAEAVSFLSQTDWKVLRHRDQVDAGVSTNLTAEEYTQLLVDRQAARDSI
jgi:homoserine kinase